MSNRTRQLRSCDAAEIWVECDRSTVTGRPVRSVSALQEVFRRGQESPRLLAGFTNIDTCGLSVSHVLLRKTYDVLRKGVPVDF